MNEIIFSPPIAFLLYIVLVIALSGIGRALAGAPSPTSTKTSTYSSGEAPPEEMAAPGYRPFFVVALFFAVLHLGVLMLGSNDLSTMAIVYLVGLMLALLALILG
jgi:NADH:ubiquinone oxidoreductase subunit 3 (subunit A)